MNKQKNIFPFYLFFDEYLITPLPLKWVFEDNERPEALVHKISGSGIPLLTLHWNCASLPNTKVCIPDGHISTSGNSLPILKSKKLR